MHGHIAVTGRSGEMRVMWGSAKSDKPRVKVGFVCNLKYLLDYPCFLIVALLVKFFLKQ